MNTSTNSSADRILHLTVLMASIMAIVQLALSQFAIRLTRLSAVETTGISLFAFIIFSLITLFAVTRMKESTWGKIFAIIMNFVTAFAATWYLRLLLGDKIFFRNLYYVMDRGTQTYELASLKTRIFASIPLALIFLGTAVYYFCGLAILIASIAAGRKNADR